MPSAPWTGNTNGNPIDTVNRYGWRRGRKEGQTGVGRAIEYTRSLLTLIVCLVIGCRCRQYYVVGAVVVNRGVGEEERGGNVDVGRGGARVGI